jgi:hypothetical protein
VAEMTLLEALQSDQVKGLIGTLVQESVDEVFNGDALKSAVGDAIKELDLGEVVKTALEPQIATIRESVQADVAKDRAANELRELHLEATRLIEASPLKGAARQNLLDDYSLVESDGSADPKPGRALALVEAELDGDGKTVKTSKAVLRESVDADVKRARAVIRENAPTVPSAPGGGGGDGTPVAPGGEPPWVQRLRAQGRDPKTFGYNPPAKAA